MEVKRVEGSSTMFGGLLAFSIHALVVAKIIGIG